jgi:cell division protein FtsB
MGNFTRKTGKRNVLYSKPVLVLLGVLLLASIWGMIGFVGKIKITNENRRIAENHMRELEEQEEILANEIDKLKTADGIEENIRMKFGLAKEGEKVVVVVEEKDLTGGKGKVQKKGFFYFITKWFK